MYSSGWKKGQAEYLLFDNHADKLAEHMYCKTLKIPFIYVYHHHNFYHYRRITSFTTIRIFLKKNALISWLLNICLWNFQSVVYIKKKRRKLAATSSSLGNLYQLKLQLPSLTKSSIRTIMPKNTNLTGLFKSTWTTHFCVRYYARTSQFIIQQQNPLWENNCIT